MICPQCGEAETTEGTLCFLCTDETALDRLTVRVLIEKGHPEHCAKRQVYGDGECDLVKSGYDPYGWMK